MTSLDGRIVQLRPATAADIPALVPIRLSPEVRRWWRGGEDMANEIAADLEEPGATSYVVEVDGRVVGWIQWSEQTEPAYRHATLDLYLDPACHGRGIGTDAVRTVIADLVAAHGHRRFEIDPAADNVAAIRCYAKVGFCPVGILRLAEQGRDGLWHDTLVMDFLADEFVG